MDPDEPIYAASKKIRRGEAAFPPPLDRLADLIAARYGPRPLNITFDSRSDLHPPRVWVVLVHAADGTPFRDRFRNDRDRERVILRHARSALTAHDPAVNLSGLFLAFSAFDRCAIWEANEKLTESELEALRVRLDADRLWKVDVLFEWVFFFLHTDRQAAAVRDGPDRDRYVAAYREAVAPHDEFGYAAGPALGVTVDSKAYVDRHCGGNLFHYYK